MNFINFLLRSIKCLTFDIRYFSVLILNILLSIPLFLAHISKLLRFFLKGKHTKTLYNICLRIINVFDKLKWNLSTQRRKQEIIKMNYISFECGFNTVILQKLKEFAVLHNFLRFTMNEHCRHWTKIFFCSTLNLCF